MKEFSKNLVISGEDIHHKIKEMGNKTSVKRDRKILPRTVSNELWELWKRLKRAGDAQSMADRFGMSRYPFDNALNHGHVAKDMTATLVNQFFKDRIEAEKSQAAEMNGLADELEAVLKTSTDDPSANR